MMNKKITTQEERTALFERAVADVTNPETHVFRDAEVQARMAAILEAEYGMPHDEAKLTAYEWFMHEIALRDPMARAIAMGKETELLDYTERLLAFWKEHPEFAQSNMLEVQDAYLKAEEEMFYTVRHALRHDGDMSLLWKNTRLSEDFLSGLGSDNPLHWRVVTRALATQGIPGVTATTLAQPNSVARTVVLDVIEDANAAAHENLEEGDEDPIDDLVQELHERYSNRPLTIVYPAAKQRERLAKSAERHAYVEDVVFPEIEERLAKESPDSTVDEEDAIREAQRWLDAQQDKLERLAEDEAIEFERMGRFAHTVKLEPDGYVAEWGAFGIGNREAEAEGTVYEVLQQ